MSKVSEVMTRSVSVLSPSDSLQRAAQRMGELNIGALPVCDGQEVVGMITDRDITVRGVAEGLNPAKACVSEVMTEHAHSCTEDQTAEEAMNRMGDLQVRRLPVLDRAGSIVGIVSLGDLATRQSAHIDNALREISSPSEPQRPKA
jgi:CBS domain-containing protein